MEQNDRILDTNVLIISNGDQSPQSSVQCKDTCLKVLVGIMAGDYRIIIDGGVDPEGSEILTEYRNKLRDHGGGFGEMFLRWLLQNWQNVVYVMCVPITKIGDTYEEFPKEKRLTKFDPRDRKWIATTLSHKTYNDIIAEIIQAADYKWKDYIEVFEELEIRVNFICDLSTTEENEEGQVGNR